jgi:hypothetical protein
MNKIYKYKKKDSYLAELVYNTLTKILIENGLYHNFMISVGYKKSSDEDSFNAQNNAYASLMLGFSPLDKRVYKVCNKKNHFFYAKSKKVIIDNLSSLGKRLIGSDFDSTSKIQYRATELINTLLHECLERNVNDLRILEDIGQKTFNAVCEHLFGVGFKDETENELPNDAKEKIAAIKEYLKNPTLQTINLDNDFLNAVFGERRLYNTNSSTEERLYLDDNDNDDCEWDEENYEWTIED